MSVRNLLQQFHHWRLGIAEAQPLELPNRAVVNRRYEILCQLGQGSVERTYLAADCFQGGQWCVLKEFVPRLLNPRALAAGREQFEQEVSLLRDLDHPQLPEFREVLECQFDGLNRWLVVQEWLEGMSYLDLVKSRPFTEAQVIQFLQAVLPVLNYLHQQDPPVIHGNLSTETILHNKEMDKPILINFGTLKHITLCIADPYADPVPPRLRLYRPAEQLQGQLDPSTDLYALAVTALTLLTGCPDPRELFDRRRGEWRWSEYVAASVGLVVILDRMLHPDPAARYRSGVEVQAALERIHSRLPVPKPQAPAVLLPTVQSTHSPGSRPRRSQDPDPVELSVSPRQGVGPMVAEASRVGLALLPAPALAQVNRTVTVVAQQAGSLVVSGLQRSGAGMRSQLANLRRIPPKTAVNVLLGTVFWLTVLGFVSLTVYGGLRFYRWLVADPQLGEIAASVQQGGGEAGRSQFLRDRELERCQVDLWGRFRQLNQAEPGASWSEVDRQFQAGFPNFVGPIEVDNPDHAFYLQEWCYFANQWLQQQGV